MNEKFRLKDLLIICDNDKFYFATLNNNKTRVNLISYDRGFVVTEDLKTHFWHDLFVDWGGEIDAYTVKEIGRNKELFACPIIINKKYSYKYDNFSNEDCGIRNIFSYYFASNKTQQIKLLENILGYNSSAFADSKFSNENRNEFVSTNFIKKLENSLNKSEIVTNLESTVNNFNEL